MSDVQAVQGRSNFTAPARKPGGRGHDAVLKALKEGGRKTTVVTLAGDSITGLITGFDKYTITLATESGGELTRRVFYKHAIEQFYGDEPTTPNRR